MIWFLNQVISTPNIVYHLWLFDCRTTANQHNVYWIAIQTIFLTPTMISANGWWCYLFILHLWNFYFHLYWHDTDVLQWRGDSKQQRLQLENKMLVPDPLSIPPWFKIFYKRYGYFLSIHGNKLTFWAFVFQHWRRHHHASSVCTLLCGSYTITWIKFGLEIISSGQTEPEDSSIGEPVTESRHWVIFDFGTRVKLMHWLSARWWGDRIFGDFCGKTEGGASEGWNFGQI